MAGVDPQDVLAMYIEEGTLATERHYGCSGPTVHAYVRKAGGVVRPPGHNIKSGRGSIDASGYRVLTVGPDWPYQEMVRSNRLITEHRKVMAEVLGRPLLPTETVHHLDGDKVNNSPENLQVRRGRHGKGAAMQCADCGSHNVVATTI